MRRFYVKTALESKQEVFDTTLLDEGWKDTIIALVENGPLFDGDVPSKHARDSLIEGGYVCRVIMEGEDGYNAATHKGGALYKQMVGVETLKEAIEKRKSWK